MCGICAVVSNSESVSADNLREMTASLTHRGPDSGGIMLLEGRETQTRSNSMAGLGHRRLAIIDLSAAGQQPMQSESGLTWIVFNGEIYNYQALRAELERADVRLRTKTDTEVILAGYETWGKDVVKRLNGMFAFMLWDTRTDTTFVARDRLGIKPLFYHVDVAGTFVCGSELKSILAYPRFERRIDYAALGSYFQHGYIAAPNTIFENVHKLKAGHTLIRHADGTIEVEQYWNSADFAAKSPLTLSEPEAVKQLDDLLSDAVRLRMISDVPLGGLLSGGVDSSLIVALMQEQSSRPVQTFTIGFDDAKFDESGHAADVAKYLGTNHHTLHVTEENLLDIVPKLAHHFDEPFADTSTIPTYAVSKMARQHVTVALSGDGGDELFLGYPTYSWMERREQVRRFLPQPFEALAGRAMHATGHRRLQRFGAYMQIANPLQAHEWVKSYWQTDMLTGLLRSSQQPPLAFVHADLQQQFEQAERRSLLERLALVDLSYYMVDDVLTKVDRASMAVALEVRVPLLDHRVVEFGLQLPHSLKRRPHSSKHLMRQLLYNRVPKALLDRPKQGFSVPISNWLKGPLKSLLHDYTAVDFLNKQALFESSVIQQMVQQHLDGKSDWGKHLWAFLVFQMWYARYLS